MWIDFYVTSSADGTGVEAITVTRRETLALFPAASVDV